MREATVSPANRDCWLPKRLASNLGVAALSAVLALALCEGLVRLIAPQAVRGVMFEYSARGYRVNRSEGMTRHQSDNVSATYRYYPPHLRGAPVPRDGLRVLVLGDSYTFGWLVDYSSSYVGQLQDSLNRAFGFGRMTLLDAAAGGMGTAVELAFLEDYGDSVRPSVVIVFVSRDDFRRAAVSPLYRLVDTSAGILQSGSFPRNPVKEFLSRSKVFQFVFQHSHLIQLGRRALGDVIFGAHPASRPDSDQSVAPVTPTQQLLARALFRRMKAWAEARSARLAVINNGWREYDWLTDLLAQERIPCFDATPEVRSAVAGHEDRFIYPTDHHPNAAGHAVTAAAVWPFMHRFLASFVPTADSVRQPTASAPPH